MLELEEMAKAAMATDVAALGLFGVLNGATEYRLYPNGFMHLLRVQRASALPFWKVVEGTLGDSQRCHGIQQGPLLLIVKSETNLLLIVKLPIALLSHNERIEVGITTLQIAADKELANLMANADAGYTT
jgi:hypothetical protein